MDSSDSEDCFWCHSNSEDIFEEYIRIPDWLNKANNSLKHCIECVKSYHKGRYEFVDRIPDGEQALFAIEVERLLNSFDGLITRHEQSLNDNQVNSNDNQVNSDDNQVNSNEEMNFKWCRSQSQYDFPLPIPVQEILMFPFYLQDIEVDRKFCRLMTVLQKVEQLQVMPQDQPYCGLFLLLIHPCHLVAKYAKDSLFFYKNTEMEISDELAVVISLILSVISFDLSENHLVSDDPPSALHFLSKHLFPTQPLGYWQGLCFLLQVLGNDSLNDLGSSVHEEMTRIIYSPLESSNNETFWPKLEGFHQLLDKLGFRVWQYLSAPIQDVFECIFDHECIQEAINHLKDDNQERNINQRKDQFSKKECDKSNPYTWVKAFVSSLLDSIELSNQFIITVLDKFVKMINDELCRNIFLSLTNRRPSLFLKHMIECLVEVLECMKSVHFHGMASINYSASFEVITRFLTKYPLQITDHISENWQDTPVTFFKKMLQLCLEHVYMKESKALVIELDKVLSREIVFEVINADVLKTLLEKAVEKLSSIPIGEMTVEDYEECDYPFIPFEIKIEPPDDTDSNSSQHHGFNKEDMDQLVAEENDKREIGETVEKEVEEVVEKGVEEMVKKEVDEMVEEGFEKMVKTKGNDDYIWISSDDEDQISADEVGEIDVFKFGCSTKLVVSLKKLKFEDIESYSEQTSYIPNDNSRPEHGRENYNKHRVVKQEKTLLYSEQFSTDVSDQDIFQQDLQAYPEHHSDQDTFPQDTQVYPEHHSDQDTLSPQDIQAYPEHYSDQETLPQDTQVYPEDYSDQETLAQDTQAYPEHYSDQETLPQDTQVYPEDYSDQETLAQDTQVYPEHYSDQETLAQDTQVYPEHYSDQETLPQDTQVYPEHYSDQETLPQDTQVYPEDYSDQETLPQDTQAYPEHYSDQETLPQDTQVYPEHYSDQDISTKETQSYSEHPQHTYKHVVLQDSTSETSPTHSSDEPDKMNNTKHVSPSMKNENTKPSLSNVPVIQRLKSSPVCKKIKAVLRSKKQKRHERSNSDSNRNERKHLEFPTDGLSTSSSSSAEISDFSPNGKSVYKYTDEKICDVKYYSQKKVDILNEKIKSMNEKRKGRCIGETAEEPSTSRSSEGIVYSNSKSFQVSSVQETADHKFKVRKIEESPNLEEITLSSDTLSTSDIEAGLDLPISTEKVAVAKKSWKIEVVSLISDSDTDTNSVSKYVPETDNRSDLMPQRLESEQSQKKPVNHHHQTYVNAIKEVASTSKVTSTGAVNLKIHKQVRSEQAVTAGLQCTAASTVAQHQVGSEQAAAAGRKRTAASTVAQHQVGSKQAATAGRKSTALSTIPQQEVRSKQAATVGRYQSRAASTVAQHQFGSEPAATAGRYQRTAVSTIAQQEVRSKQAATVGRFQSTAASTVAQHQVRSEQVATVDRQSTAVSTVAQHQIRSEQAVAAGRESTAVSTVVQHQVRSSKQAAAAGRESTAVSTVAQHQIRSEQAATAACQSTAVSKVAQHQVRSKQAVVAGRQGTAASTVAQHQVRSEQAATAGCQSTAVSTVAQHQVRSEQAGAAGHRSSAVSTVAQHQVRSEQSATAGRYQRTAVSTVAQHQRSSESVEHNVHRRHRVEINLKPTYNVKCEGLVNVILHWKPEWLEQHEVRQEEILRPLGLNVPLRENPNQFSSIDEYYRGFVPLVLLETWSEVVQEYPKNKENKLPCRCIGCPGCFIQCQAMSAEQDTYPAVSDLVILSPNKARKDNNYFVFGIIRDRKIENVLKDKKTVKLVYKLQIGTDISRYISHDVDMKMQVVASLVSNLRVFSIIEDLHKLILARDILYPRERPKIQTIPSLCPITTKLNDSQTKAADKIFTCVEDAYGIPHINLLHGPPGTGKTRTIVNIIERILKKNREEENGSLLPGQRPTTDNRPKILVCAPSNKAVDRLVLKVVEMCLYERNSYDQKFNCGKYNIVRIGTNVDSRCIKFQLTTILEKLVTKMKAYDVEKNRKEIAKYEQELKAVQEKCATFRLSSETANSDECKKAKSKREELEKCIKVLKKKTTTHYQGKEKVRNTVLKNADVVFCTLNASGCSDLHFLAKQKGHFKCVIVDEACQCTEPDTLIPLRFKSSKLVLVGDPLQLPATVVSKKATQLGFHRSLFERIYMYYRSQGTEANHVYMLNTQYRMHPEICRFPSQHFYNSRLETHRSDQEKPFPFKPYLVFDVINGREECNDKDISNRAECDMVKELILSVVHLEKIRIGIVTPYRKQKELLMDCVERLNIDTNQGIKEKIMISTVDGFQGQEKDIIILSCVRAKGRGNNIGFVAKRNRMNVALTRAKLALYVVGHLETLKTNPDWCALINDANDRKLIFKVRDRDYRRAANYCEKENRTSKRGSASSDQSHDSDHQSHDSDHHSHDSDHRSHDSDQGTRGRHRIKGNHSGQNRSNNKSVTLSDRLGELEDGEIRSQSNSPQLNEDSEPSTSSHHFKRTKQAIMAKYPGGPLIRHMDGLPYEQWHARKTKSNQPKNSSNGHKQLKRKRNRDEDLGNKSKGEERDSNKMKEHRGITAHTSFDSSVNRQQVHQGHKRHKSNNITTFERRRHRSDSITIKPVEKRKRHRSGELHTSTCKMHGDQGQQNSTASAVRASTPKLQPLQKGRRIAHTARSELPKSGQTSSNSDGQSKSSTLQLGNDEELNTGASRNYVFGNSRERDIEDSPQGSDDEEGTTTSTRSILVPPTRITRPSEKHVSFTMEPDIHEFSKDQM